MRPALLYHDVVDPGRFDASGFPGPDAARYKLEAGVFESHLQAIAEVCALGRGVAPVLTFDDGGSSAPRIAEALERHGWRGHFFITTDRIGAPGFVTADQIRDLHARGHTIGTHSCSHPARMSSRGREELLREWRLSRQVLGEILGAAVTGGSIPGGHYSRAVAEAAAAAGLLHLYTSEPTARSWTVAGCRVAGRYAVFRETAAAQAAALAAGRALPRLAQALTWEVKKLAKAAGGPVYDHLRLRVLGRIYHTD